MYRPITACRPLLNNSDASSEATLTETAKASVDAVLRNARQANSIVVLVGIGLSTAAGIPDWQSVIAGTEPVEAFEVLASRQEAESFSTRHPSTPITKRLLAELLAEITPQVAPSPVHLDIARLAPRAIVTTNYDTLMEDAIQASGHQALVLTRNDTVETEPEEAIPVFKIFGSIREPSSISTDLSASLLTSSEKRSAAWLLRAMMAVSLVIAVGFELNSKNLGALYERLGPTIDGSWFLIPADPDPDPIAKSLWINRGVQIVDIDNDDLSSFFRGLKEHAEALPAPPRPSRQGGQIFVSHTQDSTTASAVYDLLRSLNLHPVQIEDAPMVGQTIVERLDYLADSSEAAVVVLGPEPYGNRRISSNTMFELGWLVGKLGRERVLTIVTPESLPPSDLGGFQYFVFDPNRYESLRAGLRSWARNIGLEVPSGSYD
jgi:predicted nucleotide-binding protein